MSAMNRRDLLKASGAAALVVGFGARGALAAGHGAATLTPFLRIGADGSVTAIVRNFEMGQGTSTGLTTLIAEELGVTMEQIGFDYAPADAALYGNPAMGGMQGTGGSNAIFGSFQQYRQAGAAAREMLIAAAARHWGFAPAMVSLADGVLTGNGLSAPIGDFVAAAASMPVPAEPRLKEPSEWRLIGNPAVRRKDTPNKINGAGKFAMDMQLPGQLVVVIKRPPRFGATLTGFDASGAEGIKGFVNAAAMPNGAGVFVYAEHTWAALQAREAITADWDNSKAEMRSSDQIEADLRAMVNADPTVERPGERAAMEMAMQGAAQVVEQEFYVPYLAHAPMEPLTCAIARDADGGATLYDGCQFPTAGQQVLMNVLQLPQEKARVKTLYAGGSFGRRATLTADYHVECALAFAVAGGERPVKLVWSREDDLAGGYYRPAYAHKLRVGLDEGGNIVAWDHRIAGQPLFKGSAFEAMAVVDGFDGGTIEGAHQPYALAGAFLGVTDMASPIPVNWWRSVGHSHNGFVIESMMDIAARAAGRDPVAFRLAHVADTEEGRRMAGVLKLAAEKAGWGKAAEGRSQGVAVHFSFRSYVAEVVEISQADGAVKIEKITCAADCGVAVNPDVVKAQLEGGAGYGVGHAMRDAITFSDGVVDQVNFPDYEPLRMRDIAAIEAHIVPSSAAPTGIGEPGLPPAAPALANAIAATGKRVARLPMTDDAVDFA